MPPKEQLKVKKKSLKKNDLKKNPLRKNRMILPHMVTQAAQQVQPVVAPLQLDDNATTLAPQSVRQQVEMPPLRKMNEMRQSEAVIRMMPTPGFEPHSTIHPSRENHVSPPPTTNHSPSQPLTSVSSRPTPLPANLPPPIPAGNGDRTQGSRYSRPILERADDGRPMIRPDGRGWAPCRVASRALTKAIQAQYDVGYSKWSEIPKDTVKLWFEKFGGFVAWLPEHDYQIEKIFGSRGSRRLSEMYLEARNKREKPSWIGEDAWKDLLEEWKKPAYQEISKRNKKNRDSAKGGSLHTGGSITFTEHTLRMAEEFGREPTVDEVFLRTHIRKKDSSWVDDRSRKTYDDFQTKLNQASEGADESGSQTVDPATRLKLWAKSAGGKNRGRLYGVGDRSSAYRPGVSSLAPDTGLSMGCSQVSSHYSHEMATQLATLEERAKAAEDEVRNTREELRQAELKRQKEVKQSEQRASEFQRQLIALTNSVAAIQAESSRHRHRHPDYDEDESEDGSEDGYDSNSDDDY
ncbi:hypothetical protein P8452_24734 [Trifolium repens]|nr:hypothetical protein P8452_24734 [Trifolium repens]